jgi:hypothetical protein
VVISENLMMIMMMMMIIIIIIIITLVFGVEILAGGVAVTLGSRVSWTKAVDVLFHVKLNAGLKGCSKTGLSFVIAHNVTLDIQRTVHRDIFLQ